MTGPIPIAMSGYVQLRCDKRDCNAEYRTVTFSGSPYYGSSQMYWLERSRAWALGWRVFVSHKAFRQYTYCPSHAPTVDMRQVLPSTDRSRHDESR